MDLAAAVVVVELARDRPSGVREQARDGVAERGLPAVADVQRTGWIRGHELDVDRLALPAVARPNSARREDLGERARDRAARAEVDEPRARDPRPSTPARRQSSIAQ